MKVRPAGILAAVVVIACSRPMSGQSGSHTTSCTEVNWPALQSSDPGYRDAIALAQTLADSGFTVQCIAPSKMVGTFDGLQIVEREESGRYLYSFAGHPKPWPANLIDASRPLYFIKNLNRLIVTQDKELSTRLRPILMGR
jgi:hypothetical protein